ncbi:ATP-binding protein [Deltaproteobacteria bacterium TL4]
MDSNLIKEISQARYFRDTAPAILEKFLTWTSFKTFNKDEVLVSQGQQNNLLFFLIKGSVSVHQDGRLLYQLGRKGDIFGENSQVKDQPADITVIGLEGGQLLTISSKTLEELKDRSETEIFFFFHQWLTRILTEKLYLASQKAKRYEESTEELQLSLMRQEEISKRLLTTTEELKQSKNEIEGLSRLKDEYLAIASHDLRSPIGAVRATMETILEFFKVEDEVKPLLQSTIDLCNEQLSLVNNFLDISKIESGKLNLDYTPLLPEEWTQHLKQIYLNFKVLSESKHIQLRLEISENLIPISIDVPKIKQVINNLVGNALKFTSEGGHVIIQAYHPSPETLQVTVRDSGMGMESSVIQHIFDKYRQIKGKNIGTKGEKGAGLGLAICKNLVELHQGRIVVESKIGEGSQFHVKLPAFPKQEKTSENPNTKASIPIKISTTPVADELKEQEPQKQKERIREIILTSPLFKVFTPEEIEGFIPLSRILIFEKEELIIKQGSQSNNCVYFLLRGSVSVYVDKRFILNLKYPWDIFGEMSICSDEQRSADVIAKETTEILVVDSSIIHASGQDQNYQFKYYFYRMFSAIMTRKLQITSDRAKLYEDALHKAQQSQKYSEGLEQKLDENLQQMLLYSHMVNSALDGVLTMSLDGIIKTINPITQYLLMGNESEIVGQALTHFVKPVEVDDSFHKEFLNPESIQGGWCGEVWAKGVSGDQFPAYISISTIKDHQGIKIAFSCMIHDISKQKEYEQQILKQKKDLEEALNHLQTLNRLKDDFMILISHELRTPLSSILASSEMLTTPDMLSVEDYPVLFDAIYSEARRLDKLISRVLEISELESDQAHYSFAEGDLGKVIELAVSEFRGRAKEKGLELICDLGNTSCPFNFDPEKIKEVVGHLLDNALNYTHEGSIVVTLSHHDQESTVALSDTGIGIAAEDFPKVFSKFETIEDMSYHKQGMGLGMPISRLIIEAHQGKIWLESEVHQGTTFYFTLPH